MKKIFNLILFISISYSQTHIQGEVSGSWTSQHSPYIIIGETTVNTTLDIGSGVEVLFDGDYDIIVIGQLTADGVRFGVNMNSWGNDSEDGQIVYINSWNGCSLTDIEFEELLNPVSITGDFTMEISDIHARWISVLDFDGRDVSNITVENRNISFPNTILDGSNIDGLTVINSHSPILKVEGTTVKNAVFDDITMAVDVEYIIEVRGSGTLENITISNSEGSDDSGAQHFYAISYYDGGGNTLYISNLQAVNNNSTGILDIRGSGATVDINQLLIHNNTNHRELINLGEQTNSLKLDHASILMNDIQGDIPNWLNAINWASSGINGSNVSTVSNSLCYFSNCNMASLHGNTVWNNNCWEASISWGNDSFSYNPMFLDFETLELHPDSPIIDAGTGEEDLCFPPSLGTSTPDIGHNGGPGACNWDESYVEQIFGCTDPNANNYNSDANANDGSCLYDIYGCTDSSACNYDSYANVDNGNCEYDVDCNGDCGGNALEDECGVCGGEGPGMCWDGSYECDASDCPDIEIEGCMDSTANNYNPDATIDDGTCEYDDCVEVFNEGYELGAQSGDINLDGINNVQDIIILINIILNP